MILLVNACARAKSRTLMLAEKAAKTISGDVTVLNLYEEDLRPLDGDVLARRDFYVSRSDYSDDLFRYARQFQKAEEIVIAAPYWDLSFPSILKCYTEAICVNGLTFRYTETGVPEGLCIAKRLVYVTTAGGFIAEHNYGYDYVRQLCVDFFGIKNTVCIKAEGLDIDGADVDYILASAIERIDSVLCS